MVHSTTVILSAVLFISSLFYPVSSARRELNATSFTRRQEGNASASYLNNVYLLLSEFVSLASHTSFYNTSVGNTSDVVFGYFICRGDLQPKACQSCIDGGRVHYNTYIMTSNDSYLDGNYFSDTCFFRYTNQSTYGLWDSAESRGIRMNIGEEVSTNEQYNQTLSDTLNGLINVAAYGSNNDSSVLGFATKEANVTKEDKIYSLAQCTPDIVGVNCTRCLRDAVSELQRCCDGHEGAKYFAEKCMIKYDNRPFYFLSAQEPNVSGDLRQPCFIVISSMMFLFIYYTYLF